MKLQVLAPLLANIRLWDLDVTYEPEARLWLSTSQGLLEIGPEPQP